MQQKRQNIQHGLLSGRELFSRGRQLLSVEVEKVLTPAIQSALVRNRVGRVHHLLHKVGVCFSIDAPAFFAVLPFLSESADPAALQKHLCDFTRDSSVQQWVVVAPGGNF